LLVTGQPFRRLLLMAHPGVNIDRFVNTPDWMDSVAWDINAAADPSRLDTADKRTLALRSLLEDRSRLVVRKEQRQANIYTLVVAGGDGRLGPALTPSALACDSPERARSTPGPRSLPGPNQKPACGAGGSGGILVLGDQLLETLATLLTISMRTAVVDRTGLSGKFDVALSYAAEGGSAAAAPATGASIFTAIQEQLGLKLQQERTPVDFYVIERVERPLSD
jgi:uncharacterized protein (TIGR03435 family)